VTVRVRVLTLLSKTTIRRPPADSPLRDCRSLGARPTPAGSHRPASAFWARSAIKRLQYVYGHDMATHRSYRLIISGALLLPGLAACSASGSAPPAVASASGLGSPASSPSPLAKPTFRAAKHTAARTTRAAIQATPLLRRHQAPRHRHRRAPRRRCPLQPAVATRSAMRAPATSQANTAVIPTTGLPASRQMARRSSAPITTDGAGSRTELSDAAVSPATASR